MKICIAILSLIIINFSFAGTKEYIVGNGSEFQYSGENGEKVALSIYISASSFTQLGVEYFFSSSSGFLPVQAWQQYTMGIKSSGLELEAGYILSPDMTKPEIMSAEFLRDHKGIQVDDFFFSKESEIEKFKIGMEKIEVPAGNIFSSHYRKSRNGQTVDFWISDKAGAMGLVKLISQGTTDKSQNYKIELMSLIKNVKAKINPSNAVPLTDKGKMFLGKNK